eukprot:scaffold14589_cov106-Cylindrotheca_fusiformis.AAC.3
MSSSNARSAEQEMETMLPEADLTDPQTNNHLPPSHHHWANPSAFGSHHNGFLPSPGEDLNEDTITNDAAMEATPPQQETTVTAAQGPTLYSLPLDGIDDLYGRPPELKMPGSGGSADSTYVMRIHEMLEDAEREGNKDIVSWQSHGRCFRIHNEPEFVKKIMPRYFKAKIGSFRRWLRAWGFVRMTEGRDRGAWYHRYFVRGVTNLCKNMTRLQMLEAMENFLPAGHVPDFYTTSPKTNALLQNPAIFLLPNDATAGGSIKNPKRLRGTILEDIRRMLEETEKNETERSIVSWMPHGKAFRVHKKDEFSDVIMPRYFKTSKLTHLSDTLRIWGFCRLKEKGPDRGAYYHVHFVRDDPSLTRHLSRQQMRAAMANWDESRDGIDLYVPPQTRMTPPINMMAAEAVKFQTAAGIDPQTPMDPIDFLNLPPDPTNATDQELAEQAQNNGVSNDGDGVGNKPCRNTDSSYVIRYVQMELLRSVSDQEEWIHLKLSIRCFKTKHRIHEMLEDAEKLGFHDVVSWQSHGRAFRIHKEADFEKKIMPKYFKAKMASFRRWLRAWGFARMTEGKDRGAWYHRYFVRGVADLCRNMSRLQMLKAMQTWLPVGQVPNFYSSGHGDMFSEGAAAAPTATTATTTTATSRPLRNEMGHSFLNCSNNNSRNPKRLRGVVLEDLRKMLEDAEAENNTSVVTWLKHGRAFQIVDTKVFAETVMPRYFKAKKYTYFSDILRIWGFVRLQTTDKGAYFHRLFVKGKPALTRNLSRQQMKQSMKGWPLKNKWEPDLYSPDADQQIEEFLSTNGTICRTNSATTRQGGNGSSYFQSLPLTANPILGAPMTTPTTYELRGQKRKIDQIETVAL